MRMNNIVKSISPIAVLIIALILMAPASTYSQTDEVGSVAGFIYDGDGEKPVKEAVVLLRPVKEGDEYESEPTGETGDFRIEGITPGAYMAAVRIKSGKVFKTLSLVRVTTGKRLIRSFYLTPERPLAMIWKRPCGIALILSGTAVITRLIVENPKEVSPTQL